eukprot:1046886-Amphidinium_carterae.1
MIPQSDSCFSRWMCQYHGLLRGMAAVKVRCRLVEPQVQERHQFECKWQAPAYDMKSEKIRCDRARKQ